MVGIWLFYLKCLLQNLSPYFVIKNNLDLKFVIR